MSLAEFPKLYRGSVLRCSPLFIKEKTNWIYTIFTYCTLAVLLKLLSPKTQRSFTVGIYPILPDTCYKMLSIVSGGKSIKPCVMWCDVVNPCLAHWNFVTLYIFHELLGSQNMANRIHVVFCFGHILIFVLFFQRNPWSTVACFYTNVK